MARPGLIVLRWGFSFTLSPAADTGPFVGQTAQRKTGPKAGQFLNRMEAVDVRDQRQGSAIVPLHVHLARIVHEGHGALRAGRDGSVGVIHVVQLQSGPGRVLFPYPLDTLFLCLVESLVMVSYSVNKNFKGETVIKSVSEGPKSSLPSKQKVLLEDPVFNENFTIFSDDQVEARYLLTTAFMERLLVFQKDHKCKVSVLFDNTINPKSNVFLSLSFGKDFLKFRTAHFG